MSELKKVSELNMSAGGDDSGRVGTIYLTYHAKLRGNFLPVLGDASEADECVRETFRHFFYLMKERGWESDAKKRDRYLMRIAGGVCSRRLAEKTRRRASALARVEQESLLDKLRREVLRPAEQLAHPRQLFVRAFGFVRQPRLKHLFALR